MIFRLGGRPPLTITSIAALATVVFVFIVFRHILEYLVLFNGTTCCGSSWQAVDLCKSWLCGGVIREYFLRPRVRCRQQEVVRLHRPYEDLHPGWSVILTGGVNIGFRVAIYIGIGAETLLIPCALSAARKLPLAGRSSGRCNRETCLSVQSLSGKVVCGWKRSIV